MAMFDLFQTSVTELKPTYVNPVPASQRRKVTTSLDAYNVFKDAVFDPGEMDAYESFHILILNRSNQILCSRLISTGGTSGTVVDPKKIFSSALIVGSASSIICGHNHPSGNLKPSEADINLTKKIGEAGKLLELILLDHLIVSSDGYFSFADQGLI